MKERIASTIGNLTVPKYKRKVSEPPMKQQLRLGEGLHLVRLTNAPQPQLYSLVFRAKWFVARLCICLGSFAIVVHVSSLDLAARLGHVSFASRYTFNRLPSIFRVIFCVARSLIGSRSALTPGSDGGCKRTSPHSLINCLDNQW